MQDVAWHSKHEYMFGSVGDDKQLIVWDTRQPVPSSEPSHLPVPCHCCSNGLMCTAHLQLWDHVYAQQTHPTSSLACCPLSMS
jgi:hypothetical protein